jgi:S1-C subfamily serine protease
MRCIALQVTKALLVISLMLWFSTGPSSAGEIDSCKYLVVNDFTQDPYGIAKELRSQAKTRGFVVVSTVTEVPPADLLKTCVMTGSWARDLSGGELSVRVVDVPSGALVAEAAASGSRIGVAGTVRFLVGKIYSKLGYTGYNDSVYQQKILRLYPPRPKVSITEAELKEKQRRSEVEGIWTEQQDQYRLGIVAAPKGSDADYIAVVLRSNTPVWQPGEIKAEIRTTASPNVFTGTYFMLNKQPVGTTTFALDHAVLRASVKTQAGASTDVVLLRVWPALADDSVEPTSTTTVALGSGFLLSRNGLIATNWHVVAGAKNIEIAFPDSREGIRAEVAIRDATNDLAVLRLSDSTSVRSACPELPFQLASSNRVTLGERVSTIGYPLQSILGSNPKFSEGVVASQTRFQDDPRSLQISAEIEPGSSGGPLFDSQGDVIGIVVATLDAVKLYAVVGAFPQNVNWAIKSDYLLNLISMLPNESVSPRTTAFSPEKAAKCVVRIKAW